MENMPKQGILLANLGTPDEPTAPAVKRFLAQFLMDKRVVDLTRWLWCPLLHGIILPTRSPRVAKLYKTVWMDDGSPLMVYSKLQAQALKESLDVPVELGMTYGNPSLQSGIERLMEQGCKEIIVLPLFPQYSSTTTAAVSDGLTDAFKKMPEIPGYTVIRDYHDHPMYIKALADSVRAHWEKHGQSEYLLCSYHGIPKRYADNGDIYPQHCEATTRLLAQELELDEKQIGMTYQSRFGREEWLQPYTDETMEALPSRGTKKLQVITPAFSVDCLETLEEIAEENKEIFMEAGGEDYQYIPCLNADPSHIEMMKAVINPYLR
ncbi:ferrochelatase [Vibrio nigripulchritudo SFn27]|uniref:Ferrochelatase n=1 Tax=Vibrio nigripulchritudo TaxID=28173 RepID=U4K091_9VIBR|nr:ferrochelatase [Vibrio nigripulchritudo]CCN36268.1 ferrochelatase [Vibrio nigripulchritudo AM115]CCN39828.1 ferrochelatase [Vibrio nigripulchritudo FTn2]CCN65644.1 ferrochelatase [Vibrio nigripulchritudo POn4]CCN74107.1 ferrochelatase [Vibrio nigripulchritudo SO65]CCN85085.1 ferrochelatase [Vibrio nigripulchritudo BLFn1]